MLASPGCPSVVVVDGNVVIELVVSGLAVVPVGVSVGVKVVGS